MALAPNRAARRQRIEARPHLLGALGRLRLGGPAEPQARGVPEEGGEPGAIEDDEESERAREGRGGGWPRRPPPAPDARAAVRLSPRRLTRPTRQDGAD